MLRLRVVEYFDSVINEIDLFIEKKIQSDEIEPGEDWWNKRRQEQIDEVREMERACLSHVSSLTVGEIESREWMKRVFVEYCFTIEWSGQLFLVKANRYVEPKERAYLKIRVDSDDFLSGWFNTRIHINDEKILFTKIYDKDSALQEQFLCESSTIDISSWLTQYKIVKKAESYQYFGNRDEIPIQFDDGIQIQNLEYRYLILDFQPEKEALEFIKCLKAQHLHHIENITVSFIYVNTYPSLTLKCLQSINFCKRIDIYFSPDYSGKMEGNQVEISKPTDDYWLSIKSHKPIEGIRQWQFSILEPTKFVDFDQLALTLICLNSSENVDCSALGPIRTSLEWLDVTSCHQVRLPIPCELLSGWTNLNKLSFYLNDTMLTTDHLIDLPMLKELNITIFDNEIVETTKTKLSFKVPKLTSLDLSFNCKLEDWSSFLSSFSHVKKLSIYSQDDEIVRKGWFRTFDKVRELCLSLRAGPIDSQLFIGFENLTHLELHYQNENSLDRRALHKLVKLKMISFVDSSRSNIKSSKDTKYQSLFDGLYSLQSIHHRGHFKQSQSFVYFENLCRHVLITFSNNLTFFCFKDNL